MSQDLHEYVRCGLCGADNPKILFGTHQIPGGKIGGVVRCRTCGLVYRNIRQNETELSRNYGQWEAANLSPEMISGRTEVFETNLKLIEPFRRNNRVLDVGAGHGFFLRACADRGWDGYGVEPSRRAVDYAKRNFGLNVTCGTFEETIYPDEHFDAVIFLNVLEFLPDPKEALRKAHELLRPGGAVTVRFSNAAFHVAAYRFFLFLGRFHNRLNRVDLTVIHLYAFDKNSITRLLLESGFTGIQVSSMPLSWQTNNRIQILGFVKKLACKLLYLSACFLSLVSFRHLMISPSLVVIARKDQTTGPTQSIALRRAGLAQSRSLGRAGGASDPLLSQPGMGTDSGRKPGPDAKRWELENKAVMNVEEIHESQQAEWNAFIGSEMHGHFFQSWEWGDLKQKSGWRPIRLAVRKNGRITAAIQVLKLKIPLLPVSILYAPRGPIVDYNDKTSFDCLLSGIVSLAKRERAVFLQIDPDISKVNVPATSCLVEKGFIAQIKYGVIGMTLPTRIFMLNVRKDDQELLANMGHKHRQYIRLSKKKGVSIIQDNSLKGLETFYSILQETSRHKKFIIHSYGYMKSLYDQFSPHGNIKLFFAMFQGKPIATTLVITFGDKCWAMYAGMLDKHRAMRASYLLTWEILRWTRDNGYTWFDFRGAGSPDPASDIHGIYLFKKGFGPEYVEFIGDYYLVFSKLGFNVWNMIKFMLRYGSKGLRAFHALRYRFTVPGKDDSKTT